ncbi:MAG: HTTM domain-containing protein [Bacteroidetes bacterium]|nr:HTTM domain-containing protein [Bacteroidota bacterium]
MYIFRKSLLRLKQYYTLDLRALALMRIGVALIVMCDLLIRAGDLTAHYTDKGLWPTDLIHTFGWKAGYWSLHELSGSFLWTLILFVIHFVFALALLVGYKTRIATLVVWLLYISLHNRNLFVLQAGDDLLRLLLFWGLFLPWQAHYSIDAKQGIAKPVQHHLGTCGYLLLIASVYFFTVNLKDSSEWRSEGSAIYYALSLDQLRLPGAGDWLYAHPLLMKCCTHFLFYAECAIPFLILFPSKNGYLRGIAFCLIFFIHSCIGLTLYVGLFFIINIVSAIGMMPPMVMDKIESKITLLKRNSASNFTINQNSSKYNFTYLKNAAAIVALVFCLIINLSSLKWFNYTLQNELLIPVNILKLDQFWGMFSPDVMKKDGWFVYHGIDSVGRQWDLRLDKDYVDYKKPLHVVKMYKTDRWRKLAENMQRSEFTFLRPLYCRYVIKKWNRDHSEKKMSTLNLYYMQKENLPDYKTTKVAKILFSVCDGR